MRIRLHYTIFSAVLFTNFRGVRMLLKTFNGTKILPFQVFSSYLQFCGIGLRNAQLYEKSQLEVKRNQVLLDLARMIFEEQSTIEHMVLRILTHMQSLIQCQRVQVMQMSKVIPTQLTSNDINRNVCFKILLVHEATKGCFSRVFDFEANDLSEDDNMSRTRYA